MKQDTQKVLSGLFQGHDVDYLKGPDGSTMICHIFSSNRDNDNKDIQQLFQMVSGANINNPSTIISLRYFLSTGNVEKSQLHVTYDKLGLNVIDVQEPTNLLTNFCDTCIGYLAEVNLIGSDE